jgi:cbb3-type cytochrome oxidase subunit 3
MTMKTIAILGIALIMLGVVAFAYKASPTQPAKR